MLTALYLIFVVEVTESQKEEALTGFILHQSNPQCRDVDPNKELKPCTLTSQEDYTGLRSGNADCLAASGQQTSHCADGSNNMTCLPLSLTPVEYMCACSAVESDLNTRIKWNHSWEEITESGLTIKRSLCNAQAGWCLDGMFKVNLVYLVKLYAPLDSQITASSTFNYAYDVEKVRLEYNGTYCAWVKADDDISPWIKFDFLQSRVAVGVKIGKRCDETHGEQYVTSYHVSSSDDDVIWSYIGTDVQAVYVGIIAIWCFDMEVSARYWRIEPVTFVRHSSMQADLIGYM